MKDFVNVTVGKDAQELLSFYKQNSSKSVHSFATAILSMADTHVIELLVYMAITQMLAVTDLINIVRPTVVGDASVEGMTRQ
jgi:hypothetical protein